ncbi:MAG: DNA-processing protein DprA [Pirellulales bacterium]|nr:DNA-processing protein DprA [Pirellulales bacterium]
MPQETIQPSDDYLEDWLRLCLVSGVGPRILTTLIAHFQTPQAVLAADASQLQQVEGVGYRLAQAIAVAKQEIDLSPELAACRSAGIQMVSRSATAYPRLLLEIHDPPGVLFLQGDLRAADSLAIAVVGSRNATRYGVTQAARIATGLARAGVTVVAGLARGIDAAAHRAALAAGGRTLAVMGGGLLKTYPPEHAELARQVSEQGCLISEMPPQYVATRHAFPRRNRIISGLTLGTLIVEAAERSGALITARQAMEQNRDVFAVPGPVDNRNSKGCHALLRDGAILVESVEDILDALGPLVETNQQEDGREIRHPAELQLNATETSVLQAIGTNPTLVDQVVQQTELPTHRVLSTLSVLEVRQLIVRLPGGTVTRR